LRRDNVQRAGAPARLLQLVDHLFASPVIRVADVRNVVPVNPRTALAYVDKLVALGILTEITGRKRDRVFAAQEIIKTVDAPTAKQPPPP
jgi:Fic family protein